MTFRSVYFCFPEVYTVIHINKTLFQHNIMLFNYTKYFQKDI